MQVRAFDDRAFNDTYATKLRSSSRVKNKDMPCRQKDLLV